MMYVHTIEQEILQQALDSLPWSSMSWSIHRGLRDLLIAYAKPTMDKFRKGLAWRLRLAVTENSHELEEMGWASGFVSGAMADLASNAILAGGGKSGDVVRVVIEAALLLCPSNSCELDETKFWRDERHHLGEDEPLPTTAIITLTKCFVLEWSTDLD